MTDSVAHPAPARTGAGWAFPFHMLRGESQAHSAHTAAAYFAGGADSVHIEFPATAKDFAELAGEFLYRKPALNQIVLGNLTRWAPGATQAETTMALLSGATGPIVAGIVPPTKRLLLSHLESCPAGRNDAMALLAQHLAGQDLCGVTGEPAPAKAFALAYAAQRGVELRTSLEMCVYELRRVIPPPVQGGTLRTALPEELPQLVAWRDLFQVETGTPATPQQGAEFVRQRFDAGSLYVWDDGGPVATAALTRPLATGISISAVYTPPSARRKGYGAALVAALSQRMLESGYAYCTLMTDTSNPASSRIYQKIGYEAVADALAVDFVGPD